MKLTHMSINKMVPFLLPCYLLTNPPKKRTSYILPWAYILDLGLLHVFNKLRDHIDLVIIIMWDRSLYRWADRTAHISQGQRPTSGRPKKAIYHSEYSPIHAAMVTQLYRTLQWTLKYYAVIRQTWVIGLQAATLHSKLRLNRRYTWLLFIDSLLELVIVGSSYPTVPSLTLYDVQFSHNTCVTDRRQTDTSCLGMAQPNGRQKSSKLRG